MGLRWMGDTRIVLGMLHQLVTNQTYPAELAMLMDDINKDSIKHKFVEACTQDSEPVPPVEGEWGTIEDKLLAPLNGPVPEDWTVFRTDISLFFTSKCPISARGMLSHPCAQANDGVLDVLMVRAGQSFLKRVDMFAKVETGHHIDSDAVEYYKVKAFRLTPLPRKDGKASYVSIDGEHAPAKPFQVEVHRGLGSVLSLHQNYVNTRTWRPSKSVPSRSLAERVGDLRTRLYRTCIYFISIIRSYFKDMCSFIFRHPRI